MKTKRIFPLFFENKKNRRVLPTSVWRTTISVYLFLLLVGSSAVLAQDAFEQEKATPAMLFRALDLRSATDLTVFARSVVGREDAQIKGNILDFHREGAESDNAATEMRKDFSDAFSAIKQLPCTEVAESNLSGRTFTPGVYCLPSAHLAGELVLDGENSPNAIFVFRINGSLQTDKNSVVSPINQARAGGVFFLADTDAIIGSDSAFSGNILARGDIKANAGAKIDGRALSLDGAVNLNGATLGLEQTGVLEICKAIDATLGAGLENRVFRFRIGGLVTEVPAGQCSGAIVVPSGPLVVEELLDGRFINGVGVSGNFQLTGVRVLENKPQTALVSVNLPLRVANIIVGAGDAASKTKIEFTNRFAITATVEICKEPLDTGVTGFFNFTIDDLTFGPGQPSPLLVTVPVGQCTGPISIVAPTPTVTVREQPRPGFIFTKAVTTAIARLISIDTLNRAVTARLVEGGAAVETKILFYNRTAPGNLRICKIAGPGIPEMTPFTFIVEGRVPLAAGVDGVVPPGSQPSGPIPVTVPAGPASSGGLCQTVTAPGTSNAVTFVIDTTATVTETTGDRIGGINGQILTSRIKSTTGIVRTSPAQNTLPSGLPRRNSTIRPSLTFIRNPNEALYPVNGKFSSREKDVAIPIRRGITSVEFVNIAFSPVALKICKVAGQGITPNTTAFTFTVTADTAGGLLAPFTSTVSVIAGSAAVNPGDQNGFCDFVAGPFGNSLLNGIGSFNYNSNVMVTEAAATGFAVAPNGITSPTSGVITNIANRTANFTNLIFGVNEVQFVNRAIAVRLYSGPAKSAKVFDAVK